ncbi:efflux RND transporter periplasmic adaptor subunit [Methylomagnum ishizawai]|uniref:efflux RND transporter periplasmic adaptor subunit n=1 Tax=Methylomagnum ishizawai TaxID=1760988 RepID=UPI001C31EF0C|nr:efflux RND transporter periplasmic adaptor subunit [Methylomagnum ishizawai]BBL73860.1 hemolysin D [Methylomagnum ishizawai]
MNHKHTQHLFRPGGPGFTIRPALLLIGLIVSSLVGCDKDGHAPAAATPPPPPTVEVTEVKQQDVPIHQEWVGSLDGMVNAQILAQVTGYLVKQNYQEGQPVRKGQLLYEIDPRTFQSNLDQARANLVRQEALLKTARLDMDRVERLLPQNAVSVRDRDNAVGKEASYEAEVLAAKAAVESSQLSLGFTRITSPIDGIAGLSQAQIGNLVGPGSANAVLTTVSQVDPIKAYIPLSEQQYLKFERQRPNDSEAPPPVPLELTLADGSVYPHPGKLYFADRQVDIKTGTIKVATLFPNPRNLLRPGQYAKIRAVVHTKPNALLVPQRAVADLQGKSMVAVVNPDNTVAIRMVKPGETIGTEWVIDEGLKPGDKVIVEGIQKVKNGIKVDPKPWKEAAATAQAER